MAPLKTALDRGLLSIRGVDRTLRVAWTLADLAGRTSPGRGEVSHSIELPGRGRCAMTDDTRLALAYLSRVAEPPCPELAILVRRVGPVEAAAARQVRRGRRRACPAHRGPSRDRLRRRRSRIARPSGWSPGRARRCGVAVAFLHGICRCGSSAAAAGPSAAGVVGRRRRLASTTWPSAPSRSSGQEHPPRTGSTSRRTWPPGWSSGT